MSIQQITERETALTNTLRQMTEALTLVTKERDEYQLEASMWAAELKSLRDSGVELPKPKAIGLHRYNFTKDQLRDYGDRRAMAERERCAQVCAGLWRIDGQFTADEFAEAIRKGE